MKPTTILSIPTHITRVQGDAAQDVSNFDAAVWLLMSDFKKRNVDQIMHAMCFMGFSRKLSDKRLKALFAKKWFDRHGERGGEVVYVLKKSTKNPVQVAAPVVAEIPATLAETVAFYTAPTPLPVKPKAVVEVTRPPLLTLEKTDPVRVAIWKVTSDLQPYTFADLTLLLDHIPEQTLRTHMRVMLDQGSFETASTGKGRGLYYTLKANVAMPSGLPAYRPAVSTNSKEKEIAVNEPTKVYPDNVNHILKALRGTVGAAIDDGHTNYKIQFTQMPKDDMRVLEVVGVMGDKVVALYNEGQYIMRPVYLDLAGYPRIRNETVGGLLDITAHGSLEQAVESYNALEKSLNLPGYEQLLISDIVRL